MTLKRIRKNFRKETQRLAYARCRGEDNTPRCESIRVPSLHDIGCNRVLRQGDFHYDHVSAEAISHDNSLENCAVLCTVCHRIKTTQHDVPSIAQDKRVADLARGIKDPWRKRLPGGRDSDLNLHPAFHRNQVSNGDSR